MPTTTRTPSRRQVPDPGVLTAALLGLAGVAVGVLAVRRGAGPGAVLLVAVVGIGVGILVGLLPRLWSAVLFAVVLVAGLAVVRWTEPRALFAWFLLLGAGLLLGTRIAWRRQQLARTPGAATAPLRLVHDDSGDVVETVDPSADDLREAVRRLDGRGRTGLSVFRGAARLDVGGDASGAVVCFQSDDARAARPSWSVLGAGSAAWRTDEVDVRVAGVDAHLPAGSVTDVEAALTALDAFVCSGRRGEALPWRTARDVEDLRAVFDTYA